MKIVVFRSFTVLMIQVQTPDFWIKLSSWHTEGEGSLVPSSCDRLGSHNKGLACVSWHLCRVILLFRYGRVSGGRITMAVKPQLPTQCSVFVASVVSRSLRGYFGCRLWLSSAYSDKRLLLLVYHESGFVSQTMGLIVVSTFSWCCNFFRTV